MAIGNSVTIAAGKISIPERFLLRMMDQSKQADYVVLLVIGLVPIGLNLFFGGSFNCVWDGSFCNPDLDPDHALRYTGHLEVGQLNNSTISLLLPFSLFAYRWAVNRLGPFLERDLGEPIPPIISLFDETDRGAAYTIFRQRMLAPANFWIVLGIVGFIHATDCIGVASQYVNPPDIKSLCEVVPARGEEPQHCNIVLPEEFEQRLATEQRRDLETQYVREHIGDTDWTVLFVTGRVGYWQNLAVWLWVYALQFMLVFILFRYAMDMFRHNRFFITHVYQRHRESTEPSIVIDLEDPNRCFGFRSANLAFNSEVQIVVLGGAILLISRFVHWDATDIGQIFIVAGWLLALIICAAPARVKYLPFGDAGVRASKDVVDYLQAFFPERNWPYRGELDEREIRALRGRFASHYFWPSGDNLAYALFWGLTWALLLILYPFYRKPVEAWLDIQVLPYEPEFAIFLLIIFAVAALPTWLVFKALRGALNLIDPELTRELGSEELAALDDVPLPSKQKISLFLSYRRDDSRGQAGRLFDELNRRFDVYYDRSDKIAGTRYREEIRQKINASTVVLVLMGNDWVTARDSAGQLRLEDPEDLVREEVSLGLEHARAVIPIQLDNAPIPKESELPDEIASLMDLEVLPLDEDYWDDAIKRLVRAIRSAAKGGSR